MKDMKTVIDLFERSCEKFPDNPYLWEKKNGKFAATSYMEVKREVLNFAVLCANWEWTGRPDCIVKRRL